MTLASHSWTPPRQATGGRPIAFVHGLLHGAWCWSTAWCEFFRSRGLDVHLVNLPGRAGAAAGPRGLRWACLSEYADYLVEAVSAFDTPPILVGHSLGALLIQMRLDRLNAPAVGLLAPTHPSAMRWVMWRQFVRDPWHFLQAHRQGSPRHAVSNLEACRDLFFSKATPESVVSRCFTRLEEDSYLACVELLMRPKVIWRARARPPLVVLAAGEDGTVPRRVIRGIARVYGVEAEFFEGMGHNLMMEPGWERVASRLVAWLRGLGLVPASCASATA